MINPITPQDRARIRRYIMDELRRPYPDVPEASLRQEIVAFELKTFQRATSGQDYLDKISSGLVRVEPTPHISTPSCRLSNSPLSTSPPSSPPPFKRARIATSISSPRSSYVEQQWSDVPLRQFHAAMPQEQRLEACKRLLRISQGSHQQATRNVTAEVEARLKLLQQGGGEQAGCRQGSSKGMQDGGEMVRKGGLTGVKRKAESAEGESQKIMLGGEQGGTGSKAGGVGTNGSTATDVSSRFTGDAARDAGVRKGREGETDWRETLGERERGMRVAKARVELGKSSAWLAEERLMEEARTVEQTAFSMASSLKEYDEVINRSLGKPENEGVMSWRQKMPSQARVSMRLSMMKQLTAYVSTVDEGFVKANVLFETSAWATAKDATDYYALIDNAVQIAKRYFKTKSLETVKPSDGRKEEGEDGREVGREKDSGEDRDEVTEGCDGSRGEMVEGGDGGNECLNEEQDYAWARLDDESSLSGMGANSFEIGSTGEDVLDMNYIAEPPWNLDVNESQIAV